MEFKSKLGNIVADAGKSAKDFLEKAKESTMQKVDQNDDGKFDFSDVTAMAESVGDSLKRGTQMMKEKVENRSHEQDLKSLQPIFPESLDDADFLLPKLIRIVDRDKRYTESEVCQGSIGYCSQFNGFPLINIFSDSVSAFNLSFYPDCSCDLFYIDPSDRDKYISLNQYFGFLKTVRILELQQIAQSLGAKHFQVTYKEESVSSSAKRGKAGIKVKALTSVDTSSDISERQYEKSEIAAFSSFPGHTPQLPELHYLQKDPVIQSLIKMRMDTDSPLSKQKLLIHMSNTSGIKETDAIKIDGVLKGLKVSGNLSITNEVQNESRKYLEYEIEF